MGDDPPFLAVGTEVSAKYKGAFCEAKIRKVVKSVKCKILFKQGLGIASVSDEQVKGSIRVGAVVEARHPEKKEFAEATITKIQDCSQYTVVFDDGDITTLRRTALCLKSGRHFAESETLDQLPLTHPEHFSTPVIGGRRGRRHRAGIGESSDDEDVSVRSKCFKEEKEADIGRVVCVEGEKKKQKDNWFPALVVAPTAQDTVRIHVKEEYLVRSFKDGRYYTVPKKETAEFTREIGSKVDNHTLKAAVEKALQFLDNDELPPHWDRDLLFGLNDATALESDHDIDSDTSDDEPREEKDHFVAQLYKFMDDRGTPINQGPTICSKDVDLYRLFKVVHNLGGYNRVTNHNHWKTVSHKLGFGQSSVNVNLVKQVYKKFLHSFEDFYRKLGCTMVNHPRTNRNRNRSGRSLIRDKDKQTILSSKTDSKERPSDADDTEDSSIADVLYTSVENTTVIKSEVEPEENPIPSDPSVSKPKSNDVKEKPVKKPPQEPVPTKIKEEKKDEPAKVKIDVNKDLNRREKPRIRQPKLKKNDVESSKKAEVKSSECSVENKKRLFSRVAGKKEKLGQLNKPTGLALTRKKRAIKDSVKANVDNKVKITSKEPCCVLSTELVDKVVASSTKPKSKEDPAVIIPVSKTNKKEEISTLPQSVEERKRGGRKKREKKDPEEVFDTLPTYKTVCVGDKLKVYYGPTHESKVTYEAKVLSIRTENSETTYLVHYTGWNNRYDEYIKHSRIADNLSWVPGRAAKKPNLSLFKSGRKKCNSGKVELLNTGKGNSGSPSSYKAKSMTVTRCSPRNPLTKKDDLPSEVDMEEASESSTPEFVRDNSRNEAFQKHMIYMRATSQLPQHSDTKVNVLETRKFKRKYIQSSSKVESSNTVDDSRDLSSTDSSEQFRPLSKQEKLNDKGSENSDSQEGSVKKSLKMVSRETDENYSQFDHEMSDFFPLDSHSSSGSEDKPNTKNRPVTSEISLDSKVTADESLFIPEIICEDFSDHKTEDDSNNDLTIDQSIKTESDDASKGRDFDLNQIRSELKGLEKAIKLSDEEPATAKEESIPEIKQEIKSEVVESTEDVYEFKEPEPFEFEARKSSEEKSKAQRRPLNRIFEDLNAPAVKKSCNVLPPNVFYKGKKENRKEEAKKDLLESIYNFETCEETFDKICSSPLRTVTDEGSNKHFQLFSDLPEEDLDDAESSRQSCNVSYNVNEDEFFKDSSDMIPEGLSSPQPIATESSPMVESVNENSNFDSNEVESTSKSCFSRDDDDDELGDETINFAIQRAIKTEISDDSNAESISSPVSPNTSIKEKTSFSEDSKIYPTSENSKGHSPPRISCDDNDVASKELPIKIEVDSGIENKECILNVADSTIQEKSVFSNALEVDTHLSISCAELSYTGSPQTSQIISEETLRIKDITLVDVSNNSNHSVESANEVFTPLPNELNSASKTTDTPAKNSFSSSIRKTMSKTIKDENVEEVNFNIPEADIPSSDTASEPPDSEYYISTKYTSSSNQDSTATTENVSGNETCIDIVNIGNKETVTSPSHSVGKENKIIKSQEESLKSLEVNIVSLLCEETIPGSPSSHTECIEQMEEDRMEVSSPPEKSCKVIDEEECEVQNNDATGIIEESPISPESPISSQSESSRIGSPPTVDNDSSKSQSHRESEVDLDAYNKDSDEESRLEENSIKPDTSKKILPKQTKHSRKRSIDVVKKFSSSQQGSDSDDNSENSEVSTRGNSSSVMNSSMMNNSGISNENNKINMLISSSRSSKFCKYNFLVNFEPDMDAVYRINVLQSNIQQIRRVYADLKSELASIDRRKKKLRKRERENLNAARLH